METETKTKIVQYTIKVEESENKAVIELQSQIQAVVSSLPYVVTALSWSIGPGPGARQQLSAIVVYKCLKCGEIPIPLFPLRD